MFNRMFKELKDVGIIVKAGSMLDSTIIESTGKRSKRENRRDKYARGTKKHGTKYHGYKLHANVDRDTKLIKAMITTSANAHDFPVAEKIIQRSTTKECYGDKAYSSPIQEKVYKKEGIEYKVMRKAYRNKPLSKEDEEYNNSVSKIRARVEHVFGRLVNEFKLTKARYFNKYMNEGSFNLVCFLYNAVESERCDYLI